MISPDPKWLEILKASGWQMAALAAACGLFLLIAHWGWLPPLDAWMVQAAVFGLLIFGFLAIAGLINAASDALLEYRRFRTQQKASVPAHYEPILSHCCWGLAKQPDGTIVTNIRAKLFVSNLTDAFLRFLPNVEVLRPKIYGKIVSNTILVEGQWDHISGRDVGEVNILIAAKGKVADHEGHELPVTLVITSHPPCKQRVTFCCRPVQAPNGRPPRQKANISSRTE